MRPLATDEHRAGFWVQHVRVGVVLTELAALVVAGYALLADRPHRTGLLLVSSAAFICSPALLAVPVRRLSQSVHAPLFFYAWSMTITIVIAAVALLDGGAQSPLMWLIVLTLTYAGLAYPPVGVLVMGGVMVLAYSVVASFAPPDQPELLVVLSVLIILTAMIAWASRNQWDAYDQQQLLARRLETLAATDPLTTCLNRRAFAERLDTALPLAAPGRPVSLCLIDLDGFKQVNDRQGHAAGDRVLVTVANVLHAAVRETDSVSRLGGDEFAVLLIGQAPAAVEALSSRLTTVIGHACAADGVTASIGIAVTDTPGTGEELLRVADGAMYRAKSSGRNRICVHRPADSAPALPTISSR